MTFTTFCRSVLLTAQCTYINLLPNNLKIKEISLRAGRSITIPYQYIGGGARSQRTNLYNLPQHINGHGDLENVSRVLWVPKVHKPHPTNGADRHGKHKMCHKIWEVGTLVETIQPVQPPNFLNNMNKKYCTRATLCRHAISKQSLLRNMIRPSVRIPNSRGHTKAWESMSDL